MTTSILLSKLRIQVRLKKASYDVEKNMVSWAKNFFEEMSLSHSSQIQGWHKEAYLSRLKHIDGISNEEVLQAKSALLYLYKYVLDRSDREHSHSVDFESGQDIFKITA